MSLQPSTEVAKKIAPQQSTEIPVRQDQVKPPWWRRPFMRKQNGSALDEPGAETVIKSDFKKKQAAWNAKKQEIEHTVDGLGLDLDDGIKESVVAFNMSGLNTTASCEGHLDHGMATPWIDIGAANQPDTRFSGEAEIFQRIADARGFSVEDIRRWRSTEAQDAWFDAMKEARGHGETPEYEAWRAETEKQGHQTEALLDKFYADRETPQDVRLYATQFFDEGEWRIMAGTAEEYVTDELTHPLEETEALLLARRAEMSAFTDFLRARYLNQP